MNNTHPSYDKLVVYWFSGTGNAAFAAREIARLAEEKGINVYIVKLVETLPDPSGTDENTLIGFCFPTHGFNAPPVVLSYISRFPRGNADVFLLNTRAGMKLFKLQTPGLGGVALWLPALILKLKGYKLRGFRPLDMPSNWITIHPGLITSAVTFLADKCRITLTKFTDRIIHRKRVWTGLFWLPIDVLLIPISIGYYFLGRFALAKTLFASYKCNNCGLCISECPVDAIRLKSGRPYWSFKCESCMQCMNSCPERAIESSLGLNLILWWIVFLLVPYSLIDALVNHQIISVNFYIQYARPVYYFVMAVSGFILLFSGYWILHQLLRIKLFNKLLTITSLTHFKWWNRYVYKTKK